MPCYCEPDDEELARDIKLIRIHAKAIVKLIKRCAHPTSRYPELLTDTIKLLEHLYTGECDEK